VSRRGPPQPASQRGGDDEALAFAEAMRDAKPLASAGRGPPLAAPAPASVAPSRRGRDARLGAEAYDAYDAYDASDATLAGSATFVVETFGGSIEGRAVGVDVKLLRRLKSGELPVPAEGVGPCACRRAGHSRRAILDGKRAIG